MLRLRVRGRIMLLTWWPRPRVALLLRRLVLRSLSSLPAASLLLAALTSLPAAALSSVQTPPALPTNGVVVAGAASINPNSINAGGNAMTVTQSTSRAIINWDSFNIGAGASVNFVQPDATSAILNRVVTNNPSSLLGSMTSNGKVWLINPAGIMVGRDASIDVAGFVASTLAVRDEDFLANRFLFGGNAGAGAVRNFGSVTTPQGGSVYLIAPTVENQGIITAPGGEVLLAAGQAVQLLETGTPGVAVEITGTDGNVTNLGQIVSRAGQIGLSAALIRNRGALDASSAVSEGGRIFLRARTSLTTEAASTIVADGTSGGTVSLASEQSALFDGVISAQGTTGPGGSVEMSGKTGLGILRAPRIGQGGNWVVRTDDLVIQDTASVTDAAATAFLTPSMIQSQLDTGVNLILNATGVPTASANGNITVNMPIVKSGTADAALTLQSNNNLLLNADIMASTGKLDLVFLANRGQGNNGAMLLGTTRLDAGAGGGINAAGLSVVMTSGTAVIASPAVLGSLSVGASGMMSVDAPLTVVGAIAVRGGQLTLGAASTADSIAVSTGRLTSNADLRVTSAGLSGGVMDGTGGFYATNLDWSGGTIRGNSDTPSYEITNLSLHGGGPTLAQRTMNLAAGGTSSATGVVLGMSDGAVLSNRGTINLYDNAVLGATALRYDTNTPSRINNFGTINSNSTLGFDSPNALGSLAGYGATPTQNVDFANTGRVSVTSGALIVSSSLTQGGAFNAVANGPNLTSLLQFGVPAAFSSGAQTLDQGVVISQTSSNGGVASIGFGGSVVLNRDLMLENGVINTGAYLSGSGKLIATNLLWSGGTIVGTGGDPAYDVTNLSLSNATTLDGRRLNQVAGGGTSLFVGTLTLANNAVLATNGSSLRNPPGAVVRGNGTIELGAGATFANQGTVAPGDGDNGGMLRVVGNYTQGDTGSLNFSIGGGPTHGVLDVAGDISMGGTLRAMASSGYTAAPGDRTVLITASGAIGGSFGIVQSPVNLLPGYHLATGEAFRLEYVNGADDYFDNRSGDFRWANPENWSGGLPGAHSAAVITSGLTVQHDRGEDYIGTLTVASNNGLTVSGGSLAVKGMTTDQGVITTRGTGMLGLDGGLSGAGQLTVNGGAVNLTGSSGIASLQVASGTYTGNGDLNATSAMLYQDGVMQGSGKLTATNFTWSGGTVRGTSGDGTYTVRNLTANGFDFLDGRTLNLSGGTSSITAGVVLRHGGVFNNAGLLNLGDHGNLGYAYIDEPAGRGLNAVTNTGTINSATSVADSYGNIIGSTIDASDKTTFTNTGTINVTRGLLQFGGDGTHTGTYHVAPSAASGTQSARLSFGSNSAMDGVQVINPGSTITASSNTGAPASVIFQYGTTYLNTDLNLADVSLLNAALGGSGKLSATNVALTESAIFGSGGTVNNPAYDFTNFTLTSSANARLTGGINAQLAGRTVNLRAGGRSLIDASVLSLSRDAILNNAGTLSLRNGAVLGASNQASAGSRIDNTGMIVSDARASADPSLRNVIGSTFNASSRVGFINTGILDASSGGLDLHAGLRGNGLLNIVGADVAVTGAAQAASLQMVGGTLSGDGNLTVTRSFRQQGGSLSFSAGTVDLTQSSGMLQVGAIDAAVLRLNSASGAIGEVASDTGIRATRLDTHSVGGIDLGNAANRIVDFTGVNTSGGAMTVINGGAISLGPIANTGGTVSIDAGGAITQSGATNAAALRTSSVGGSLLAAANSVGRFIGQNSGSGDITLVNTSRPGTLTLDSIDNGGGGIVVDNTGGIVVAGNLNARNGDLTLTAHSPITVDAGLYATGAITLNALSSAPGGDVITINGTLNSSRAGISLDASTDTTVASTAVLSVASGSPMNLTADTGRVTVVNGATLLGAVPTIRQGAPHPPAPVPHSPPPATAMPAPESGTASIQPTEALVEGSLRTPIAVSRENAPTLALAAMTTTPGTGRGRSALQQTIGGTVDSFGGPESDPDEGRTARDAVAARPLPVCN